MSTEGQSKSGGISGASFVLGLFCGLMLAVIVIVAVHSKQLGVAAQNSSAQVDTGEQQLKSAAGMSTPSEDDARTAFSHTYPPLGMGIARIKSFQKTNGVQSEVFGVKAYQLDYSAEVEWIELTPETSAALAQNPSWREPPGYISNQTGSFLFQKTEKGWKCDKDGQIY